MFWVCITTRISHSIRKAAKVRLLPLFCPAHYIHGIMKFHIPYHDKLEKAKKSLCAACSTRAKRAFRTHLVKFSGFELPGADRCTLSLNRKYPATMGQHTRKLTDMYGDN